MLCLDRSQCSLLSKGRGKNAHLCGCRDGSTVVFVSDILSSYVSDDVVADSGGVVFSCSIFVYSFLKPNSMKPPDSYYGYDGDVLSRTHTHSLSAITPCITPSSTLLTTSLTVITHRKCRLNFRSVDRLASLLSIVRASLKHLHC